MEMSLNIAGAAVQPVLETRACMGTGCEDGEFGEAAVQPELGTRACMGSGCEDGEFGEI